MINFNKGQFSSIEIILLIFLFAFTSSYLYKPIDSTNQDYKLNIDSGLDSIYYSNDYRNIIMNENLTESYITEDWSTIYTTLNKMYSNYELILSDSVNSKTIHSCKSTLNYSAKYFTERVIAIENNSNFEFRKIRLGVCY